MEIQEERLRLGTDFNRECAADQMLEFGLQVLEMVDEFLIGHSRSIVRNHDMERI